MVPFQLRKPLLGKLSYLPIGYFSKVLIFYFLQQDIVYYRQYSLCRCNTHICELYNIRNFTCTDFHFFHTQCCIRQEV